MSLLLVDTDGDEEEEEEGEDEHEETSDFVDMARGGSKRRVGKQGNKHKNFHHNKSLKGKFNSKSFNKKDSSHLKQYGEGHPSEDPDENVYGKRRKYAETKSLDLLKADSSEDDSGDDSQVVSTIDPYTQLLSTFSTLDHNLHKKAIESDQSEEDDQSEDGSTSSTKEDKSVGDDLTDDIVTYDEELESENVESTSRSQEESSTDDDCNTEANVHKIDALKSTDSEEEDNCHMTKEEDLDESSDPFIHHFHYDMSDTLYESVSKEPPHIGTHHQNWPILGQMVVQLPKPLVSDAPIKNLPSKMTIIEDTKFAEPGFSPTKLGCLNLSQLYIKPQICDHVLTANLKNLPEGETSPFTPLQKELFSLMCNYQDVFFPYRTLMNGEEVRFLYCLHAVNHILKTRSKVLHHNARLAQKTDVPEEFRDQGLVRPKVVILVPFRESALRVVKMIIAILFKEEKANVMHMKRFVEEHSGEEIAMPKKNPRPEDYEATFAGNTDDTFRIGMTVTRKSLKLYADFYSADIIVASPLGLRVIIGAEGEANRDFDFLASVELLVLDQTELFLMQNWDHLLHVLDHFHLQPKESHGTDFARVRSWALNGWTRYYRQTLVFSSIIVPEINALFNKKCHNYAGKIRVVNPILTGTICQVVVQLPQVFHRFEADSVTHAIDARFDFFVKKILPQYKDSIMSHTMVYVPSYFDFVCLRNYFKREDLSFVQICEYSKDGKVARARDMFFHTDAHFLVYSERFHFFRRFRIKGIRHLIFYQPPTFPHLYSEMCNLMHESNQNKWSGNESNMTVTVLYSKYDVQQLAAVVGTDRAKRMMSSDRNVHMFMTGE